MRVILFILLLSCPASAVTRFVSETATMFVGGLTCNGQMTISRATFNGTTNSPDDIDVLCGTLQGAITPLGNGSSGHVVIIRFDVGSAIVMPALPTTGAIVLTNLQHYLIDGNGGSCGYVGNANVTCAEGNIQSTANGSGLANQVASVAIEAGGTTDVEIKGLLIGPIYKHTSTSDLTQSPPGPICVHFVAAVTINIHNNTMHDAAWCMNGNVTTSGTISNNEVYNYDHGVGMGGANLSLNIHDNHFHDSANWDTSNNSFHHDGIHIFTATSETINGVNEYNNLFDGDQGVNNTASIYNEFGGATSTFENVNVYNNVAIYNAGRCANVGIFSFWNTAGSGAGTTAGMYNNTVYGQFVVGCGSCLGVQGWNSVTRENNVLVNCQNLIGITNLTTDGTSDYNAYENLNADQSCGPNCNTFTWKTNVDFPLFATWQNSSNCNCDSHGLSNSLTNLKLNGSNGRPLSGSPLLAAGLNLTSLSIATLNSDILGNARPAMAAWDMGAYFGTQSSSTFTTPVVIISPGD